MKNPPPMLDIKLDRSDNPEDFGIKTWSQLTPVSQSYAIRDWLTKEWSSFREFAQSQCLEYQSALKAFKSLGFADKKKVEVDDKALSVLEKFQEQVCEAALLSVEVTKAASVGFMELMRSGHDLNAVDFAHIQEQAGINATRMGYLLEASGRTIAARGGGLSADVVRSPKLQVPAEVRRDLNKHYSLLGQQIVQNKEA